MNTGRILILMRAYLFRSRNNMVYKTAIKRLGYSFLTYVRNAVKSNRLLYGDAHALTGCHSDMFETLMYKNALN